MLIDDIKEQTTGSLKEQLDKVTDGNGMKVIIQLFCTYFFFCKSMARDFVLSTITVYFTKVLFADDTVTNNMLTAATSPYGIKTLWGSMSDALPCFGYHKRFYIIWGVCVSLCCIITLAVLNPEGTYSPLSPAPSLTISITALLFFGTEYGGATVDSLSQARYTEFMKEMGTPTIVSFVWFLINSCTLLSAWGNWLVVAGQYKILLYFAIPVCLPMLYPAAMNWLFDKPVDSMCSPDCTKVMAHKGIFAMSMVLACGALGGSGLLIIQAPALVKIIYYGSLGTVFVVMSFMVLDYKIAAPAFYMFLCSALRLFFNGTLQGWYTYRNFIGWPSESSDPCEGSDDPDCISWCIKSGPGFETNYYQFVGNFVGAIAATFAVVLFEMFISKWSVRAAFWVTTMFQMFSTCLELAILQRWNHSMFGTDPLEPGSAWVDQLFFLVGAQALDKIIEMLDFMPCNVLIGKLCPAGMEATIFAVLAGSQNFGTNLARVFGALAVEYLGVSFTSGSNKCTNPVYEIGPISLTGLACARAAGGILLPALTIPLTFVLLPNRNLNDNFLDEDIELSTSMAEGGEVPHPEDESRPGYAKGDSILNVARSRSGIAATSYVSLASVAKSVNGARDQMF